MMSRACQELLGVDLCFPAPLAGSQRFGFSFVTRVGGMNWKGGSQLCCLMERAWVKCCPPVLGPPTAMEIQAAAGSPKNMPREREWRSLSCCNHRWEWKCLELIHQRAVAAPWKCWEWLLSPRSKCVLTWSLTVLSFSVWLIYSVTCLERNLCKHLSSNV